MASKAAGASRRSRRGSGGNGSGTGGVEVKMSKRRPPARADETDGPAIRVRGAKEHNLKDIDVTIPRDRLVVMTGLSGSGKSSLAFDTIFAEGQRKYMESLSAYARQFLDQLKKPDVEEIEGIPPTIAIEQRSAAHNPRSTVATTTEIYDYLRLLYARCGTPYSWAVTKAKKDGTPLARSGRRIEASSATQIVDAVMGFGEGTRLMILAPVVRGKKGFHKDVLEEFFGQGWGRARVNGEVVDLREVLKEGAENPLNLHRYKKHTVEAVVDRVVIKEDARQRLAESIEAALRLGDGGVVVSVNDADDKDTWADHTYSEKFADPDHPEVSLEELSPRVFSFNSPFGACPTCHGLGAILEFDEELVVPDYDRTLAKGGIAPWKKNGPGGMIYPKYLRRFCRAFGVNINSRIEDLSDEIYEILLWGADAEAEKAHGAKWQGVIPMLSAWFEKTESAWAKDHLHQFQTEQTCPECRGDRLRVEALHVQMTSAHTADTSRAFSETVIGRPKRDGTMLNISELSRLNITDAIAFVEGLKLSKEQSQIAEPILREVGNRLKSLRGGASRLSARRRCSTW